MVTRHVQGETGIVPDLLGHQPDRAAKRELLLVDARLQAPLMQIWSRIYVKSATIISPKSVYERLACASNVEDGTVDTQAMIIVWAIAIYRKASLPRLIAMQRRVLAETMIKATAQPPVQLRFHS